MRRVTMRAVIFVPFTAGLSRTIVRHGNGHWTVVWRPECTKTHLHGNGNAGRIPVQALLILDFPLAPGRAPKRLNPSPRRLVDGA